MRNLFFVSFMLLFLASCTNVHFVNPQPEFVEALIEIPDKYHGEFLIDDDSYIVTKNTIDGVSISNDSSIVIKERGSYLYVNMMDDDGYYLLRVIKLIKFLDYEQITLYNPKRLDKTEEKFFDIVGRVGNNNEPVLDNVTVTQLSILSFAANTEKVLRLK